MFIINHIFVGKFATMLVLNKVVGKVHDLSLIAFFKLSCQQWTRGTIVNNPILLKVFKSAECWAHFMCQHEFCLTSVSHLFPFFNICRSFSRKHNQKITIPVTCLPRFLHSMSQSCVKHVANTQHFNINSHLEKICHKPNLTFLIDI